MTGFQRVWQYLSQPHPSLTGIEIRRQSFLLAAMILAVMMMSGIASILLMISNGITPTVVGTWIGIGLSLILYLVNRSGKYQISATGFVSLNFVLIHLMSLVADDLAWLLFTSMLMILCAVLLPRWTGLLFVVSLAAQIALAVLSPTRSEMGNIGTIGIFLVTAPLILVFINHRTRLEDERQEELRRINIVLRESEATLEQRVEERTQALRIAHEEAEAARIRAEEADQMKMQFLASMSHELRTPLNAILNFTEFVSLGMLGPVNEKQRDVLDKSLGSARHLLDLINDLLDSTKIQSRLMKLNLESDIDLHPELAQVIDATKVLLQDKAVVLIQEIDPALPAVRGDRRRIRQVLLNLMSNAAKFTQQGSITLRASLEDSVIHFEVIDTGPGISPEDQRLIFEPFVQAKEGMYHSGGTGLGLAISRGLAEAHGGRLWVESEIGKGAAFHFTLPVEAIEVTLELAFQTNSDQPS